MYILLENIFIFVRKSKDMEQQKVRRNRLDCKFWKPRGKKTHYCSIDSKDPLKQCYGVCKEFVSIKK